MQVQIIRPDGRQIVVGGTPGAPRTPQELQALHLQRNELQEQIGALRSRGHELDGQLQRSATESRPVLQARMAEVEARKLTLESRVDQLNERIANAQPSALFTITEPPMNLGNQIAANLMPIMGIVSVFFLFPLAMGVAMMLWRRGRAPQATLNEQALTARLDQLQNSVDTMAVEIERISEGQRYVSKVMGQKEQAALPR